LVDDRTATDPDLVVGEEAHIVARSLRGPRGGLLPDSEVDKYDNLILLCRNDHRVVDGQSEVYTRDCLLQIKKDHERWAASKFGRPDVQPVRLGPHPDDRSVVQMRELKTGSDVWDVIADSHAYRLATLAEGDGEPGQCDLADEFLDAARDWAEISGDIADTGQRAIREAMRSLGESLAELAAGGLVAYGGRRLLMSGGKGPPSLWWEAVLQVRLADPERPASWIGLVK